MQLKIFRSSFFPRIEHLVRNCVTEETAKWEKSLDLVHLHKVHFSPNSPPQILIVLWGFFAKPQIHCLGCLTQYLITPGAVAEI